MSISVSRRSVFALRCSRDTATRVEWMTKGSTLRARNQRANQNPSRPASKARTIRVITRPPFIARSRQPSTKRSSAVGSGSNFFKARLSNPGTTPAASQLVWLISSTTTMVLFCSKAIRERLRSSTWVMGAPPSVFAKRQRCQTFAAVPIASGPKADLVVAHLHRPLPGFICRSLNEPSKNQIVILHMGLMAAETCLVLGAIDRLPVDEAAEAPSAGRCVFLRVLNHDLHRRGAAGHEGAVELRRRFLFPGELRENRPVRERKGPLPVGFHRDGVAENA